jgi:hypothetical protein
MLVLVRHYFDRNAYKVPRETHELAQRAIIHSTVAKKFDCHLSTFYTPNIASEIRNPPTLLSHLPQMSGLLDMEFGLGDV